MFLFLYINIYVFCFLNSALQRVLQLGQCSHSFLSRLLFCSLVTCDPLGISKSIPIRNAYREITQMNTMELNMELDIFSCVFLASEVSVPRVRNDYFKEHSFT